MTDEVTFVADGDLLDDDDVAGPGRPPGPPARRLAALVFAAAALALLTLLLADADGALSLEGKVLLYLLIVVLVALLGGPLVAVLSAAAAALLINFFFVDPVHTLDVKEGEQALALVIFVGVAAVVSGAVELAGRRGRAAERALAGADTLSTLAGADLDGRETLRQVLERARTAFGMQTVVLKHRAGVADAWEDVEQVGATVGEPAPLRFDVPVGELRLIGRGPAMFAEDRRVLNAFAAAAQTAYEGRRLSEQARRGRALAVVDRQRTALLAAVGHDLRTPLAGIKAAVTSLRQTDVELPDADRRELLETVEDSADRLDAIVTNLLDASRLEAGALVVRSAPVALDEVVGAALLAIGEPSGRVHVDVGEDLPLVLVDAGLLERVLVNLLDNALRFSHDAPVEVRAHAGTSSAKLEIADHGPGLSASVREQVFEPFKRLDERGGIGLGLSVARGFTEAMGGALAADRGGDGGLVMRVRLPLANGTAR